MPGNSFVSSVHNYRINSRVDEDNICDKIVHWVELQPEAFLLESGPGAPGSSMEAIEQIGVAGWLGLGGGSRPPEFHALWIDHGTQRWKHQTWKSLPLSACCGNAKACNLMCFLCRYEDFDVLLSGGKRDAFLVPRIRSSTWITWKSSL